MKTEIWKALQKDGKYDFSKITGDRMRNANIAQLVEQQFRKLQVKGSSPFVGSSLTGCSAAW